MSEVGVLLRWAIAPTLPAVVLILVLRPTQRGIKPAILQWNGLLI